MDALDDFFRRSVVRIRRGATVTWDFTGTRTHTATDGTGMDLYDSGLVSPGGPSFSYTFDAAGVYRITCTLHAGMNGRAKIPMRARPSKVARGSRFSLIWSSVEASPGSVFDVQVKRAGHEWKSWKEGVAASEGSYRADRRGTYLFRARMRDDGSSQSSDWSEAESVRAV